MSRSLIVFFLFFLQATSLLALEKSEEALKPPEQAISRQLDSEKLAQWAASEPFQYDATMVSYDIPFWDIISDFFVRLFSSAYGGVFTILLEGLLYLSLVIMVVLIVLHFSGTPVQSLFFKSKKKRMTFQEVEHIAEVDFEELTAESIKRASWKDALRFSYLRLLQLLSENELIEWRIEKTNSEYVREVEELALRKAFMRLTHLYERVWYGHFPFSKEHFEESSRYFEGIKQRINRKENE